LKLVVLQSRSGLEGREVISERTFENVARFTHKPNGFWHVSFSYQRTSFLSGRKATADSNIVTPEARMSRRRKCFPQWVIAANTLMQPNSAACSLPREEAPIARERYN